MFHLTGSPWGWLNQQIPGIISSWQRVIFCIFPQATKRKWGERHSSSSSLHFEADIFSTLRQRGYSWRLSQIFYKGEVETACYTLMKNLCCAQESRPTTSQNRKKTLFQGAVNIYCVWWCIYYSMIKQNKCSRTRHSLCFYRFTAFQSWKRAEMLSSSHVLQIRRLRLQVYSHQTSPFQSITNTTPIPRGTVHCLHICLSHMIRSVYLLRDLAQGAS